MAPGQRNSDGSNLHVLVPRAEYDKLSELAKGYGMTLQQYAKSILIDAANTGYTRDFLERKKELLLAALDKVNADLDGCPEE